MAFGTLAQSLGNLGKGSRIEVVGHFRRRVDERDGVRFVYSELITDRVDFVSVKKPGAAEAGLEAEAA